MKQTYLSSMHYSYILKKISIAGSRFALMEIKAIIYHLILNFRLVPNEKTDIPAKLKKTPFTVATENGMHLSFEPRKT